MMNDNNFDQVDVPTELEEQAQLLEQKFRDEAIAKAKAHYIRLDGIDHPDDVVEDLECEQCGAPVPKARVKILMAEFIDPHGNSIWKADPNALICVECASANEKRQKQYWTGAKTHD